MSHTPGPWLFGRKSASSNFDKSAVYRVSGDHMVIADVRSSEDDARLISAAPQLAEALRACEAVLSAQMLDGCTHEELNEARTAARAALADAGAV